MKENKSNPFMIRGIKSIFILKTFENNIESIYLKDHGYRFIKF